MTVAAMAARFGLPVIYEAHDLESWNPSRAVATVDDAAIAHDDRCIGC